MNINFYKIGVIFIRLYLVFFSLLTEAQENKLSHKEVRDMLVKAENAWGLQRVEKSIVLGKNALHEAQNLADAEIISDCHILLGHAYRLKGDNQLAINQFHLALQHAVQAKKLRNQVDAYTNLSVLFRFHARYDSAMHYATASLELLDKIDDSKLKVKALNNLGVIYKNMDYVDKAFACYQEALQISNRYNLPVEKSITLKNLGTTYWKLGQYDSSFIYYKQALQLLKHAKNYSQDIKASILNNIGNVLRQKKMFPKAIQHYKLSLAISQKNGDKNLQAIILKNLGLCHLVKQELDSASNYFEESLKLIEQNNLKLTQTQVLSHLSSIYAEKKDFKRAYTHLEHYFLLKDSIQNLELARDIAEKETVKMLEEKQEILKTQKQFQSFLKWLILVSFLFLIVLFIVIYFSFSYRKKMKITKQKMEETNANLLAQQEEIIAQTDQIEHSNYELEKLSIVASKTDNSIAMLNKAGEIIWVNESFKRIFKYSLHEYQRLPEDNIFKENTNKNTQKAIRFCSKHLKPYIYMSSYEANKQTLWFQTTFTPIFNQQNEVAAYVVIDTEISKLIEAEQEIQEQKDEISTQLEYLNTQNKQVKKAIEYASRIQKAAIPAFSIFADFKKEAFLLNLPKDIVSGDFFWAAEREGKLIVAIADCTGHGVPGAFLSMLGITLLNQIINNIETIDAAEMLNELKEKIIVLLHQQGKRGESTDGMDIALCVFDFHAMQVQYAGAFSPIYLVRNQQINKIQADRMPIGFYERVSKSFSNNFIPLGSGDLIYLFSDGYIDQFGGEKNKRFMSKRFGELLVRISSHPMAEQQSILNQVLNDWKGDKKQLDDILILGIKI